MVAPRRAANGGWAEVRLLEVVRELDELSQRLEMMRSQQRSLRNERGQLVRFLIDKNGWKGVSALIGVGKSRLYAMRNRATTHSPHLCGQITRLLIAPGELE